MKKLNVMLPPVVRWEMLVRRASFGLILSGVFYATIAFGGTYKCRSESGQIMYSDVPCPVSSKTEKIISFTPAILAPPQVENSAEPNAQSAHQANIRYIDMKVDDAISARDFRNAKQWALTPEHWKKIKDAEQASETPVERVNVELKQPPQGPIVQSPQQANGQQKMQQQVQQLQETLLRQQQQQHESQQQRKQQQLQQLQQQELKQQQLQQQATMAKQQQAAIDRQQRRQACINQIQAAAAGPIARRAIEGAGTSASSMQALLAQRAAVDAARCNSIQ